MTIVCLDMEGVLVPEIWITFAEKVGIPEFTRTTRDEPDFDKLMHFRIDLMRKHRLTLDKVIDVIDTIEPFEGAREFIAPRSKRTVLPRGRLGDLPSSTLPIIGRPHPAPSSSHCKSKRTKSGAFTSANCVTT